ncbi:cytidine deaminase-like protein [Xylariaceae sp. FL0804]|nr:cytidine deaminase-like protein [Xylariaceae sp. FL0804]
MGEERGARDEETAMADHKISGYMSNLWQALFALLAQLFNRVSHPANPDDREPRDSRSAAASAPPPTSSSSPDHAPVHVPAAAQADDIQHNLDNHVQPDPCHCDQMGASKKRGGQKRPPAHKALSSNSGPPPQSNGPAPKPGPSSSSSAVAAAAATAAPRPAPNGHASSGVTPLAKGRDTAAPGATPQPREAPARQLVDARKENAAPPRDGQSAALKPQPVPVPDNRAGRPKPGTRSQDAARPSPAPAPVVTPASLEARPCDQLCSAVQGLTLDAPHLDQKVADTAVTAPPSVLPKPTVVTVPFPSQPAGPKFAGPEIGTIPILPGLIEPKTEEERVEREYHLKYMREALQMGQLALDTNETPVGCVLVYHGRIIAKGMNATNVTRNGTRHAEFMALSALLSRREQGDVTEVNTSPTLDEASWGDIDPKTGHIYPYGQKLHPGPVVDRSIITECVLYVTVEPCVMCASLLRQLGIKKVYFGAVNDKFGGTGGVFRVHMNSKPVVKPEDRMYQNGYGPNAVDRIAKGRISPLPRADDDGDGGNVEPGYPVEGGYLRDEAVSLLRRFYVQENGRAPQPRKKEGRAARLFAMEEAARNGSASELSDNLPETPLEGEPSSTTVAAPLKLVMGAPAAEATAVGGA